MSMFISGSSTSTGSFHELHIADRVGIGTSTPLSLLSLTHASNTNMIELERTSVSQKWAFLIQGASGNEFKIHNETANTDPFTIKTNGNIGIGETSPSAPLHIKAADVTEGSAKGQIIIEDTAAYNASPTSGLIFYGKYTNAGGKAYFSSIFGGKENTNEDYDGFLAFATRKHGSTTAERMRITSEGHVGIGTDTPFGQIGAGSLHIYGNHNSSNTILKIEQDGASSSALIQIDSAADRDSAIYFQENGTGKAFIGNDASAEALVLSDGSGGLNNLMYLYNGNVGISDSSPSRKLDVNGTGRFTGQVNFNTNILLASGANLYLDGGSNTYIKESATDTMQFVTGGSQALLLDVSGNATLAGNLVAGGNLTTGGQILSAASSNIALNPNSGLVTIANHLQTSGNITVGGNLATPGYGDVDAAIDSLTSGGISKSGTPVDNQVAVFTGANQVEGSSNLTFASNVLAVGGDMTVTGTITAQEFKTEFVSSSIVFESGSTIFGNSTDDTHTFTGNVNISGSSTSSLFTVDGTQGRLFGVTDELSGSLFSANTISGLPVIEAFSDNKVTLGPYSSPVEVTNIGNLLLKNNKVISFEDSGGTARGIFRLNSSDRTAIGDATSGEVISVVGGRVGIGSTSPHANSKLNVENTSGVAMIYITSAADNDTSLVFEEGASAKYMMGHDYSNGGKFVISDGSGFASGTLLTLDSSANLVVNGEVQMSSFVSNGASSISSRGIITFDTGEFSVYATTSNKLKLGSNNNDNHLVIDDGNVGIGETSPGYPLEVVGATGNTVAKFGETMALHMIHNAPVLGFNLYYNSGYKFGEGSSTSYGGYLALSPGDGKFTFATSNAGNAGGAATMTPKVTILNSGNVGIGTATPSSSLHVHSNSGVNTATFQAGSGATNIYFEDAASNYVGQLEFSNSSTGLSQLVTRNTSDLRLGTNNAAGITISGSNQNVGIGTTTPTGGKLHVAGTGFFGGNLQLNADLRLYNGTAIRFHGEGVVGSDGSTQTFGSTAGNVNTHFAVGGITAAMVISGSTGNVGIGTETPAVNLHIEDSVNDTDYTNNSLAGGTSIVISNQQVADNTFSSLQMIAKEAGGTDQSAAIVVESTSATSYSPKLHIVQRTASNTLTERLTIDETGNVGIGMGSTSNDSNTKFQVEGTNSTNQDYVFRNNHGTAPSRVIVQSNDTGTNAQLVADHSNTFSWVGSSTGGTSRIVFPHGTVGYFDGSRFGVRVSSPESILDISGSAQFGQLQLRDGTNQSIYRRFYVSASGAHGLGTLHIQNRAFPGSGTGDVYTHFKSSVSGGTTRMNVMVDGKLGLGSADTIPVGESLLEVRHSGRASAFDAADSTTWADVMVRNPQSAISSSTGIAFQIDSNYHTNASTGIAAVHQDQAYEADMAFITRGHNVVASEKMRITSGGNVGIGTTTPTGGKLHVAGTGFFGGNLQLNADLRLYNGTAIRFHGEGVVGSDGSTQTFGSTAGAVNTHFAVGGITAAMMISGSTGNVGIGTTNPDYTLDVAGNVGIDEYLYHNGDPNTYIHFLDDRLILFAGSDNILDYEEGASSTLKLAGGGEADVTIGDSSTFFVGGSQGSCDAKVGIGYSNPDHHLTIKGSVHITSNSAASSGGIDKIRFSKAHAASPGSGPSGYVMGEVISFTSNGYAGGLQLTAGKHEGSGNYGIETVMHIGTHTGQINSTRVGIGTVTPSQKLDVVGNIATSGEIISTGTGNNSFSGSVGIGTSSPDYQLELEKAGGGFINMKTTDTVITDGDVLGTIQFSADDATASGLDIGAQIRAVATDNYQTADSNVDAPTRLEFITETNVATDTMSTPTMVVGGDDKFVGIGTTSPVTRLHIESGGAGDAHGSCIHLHGDTATNYPVMRIDNATGGNATDTHGLLINNTGAGAGLRVNDGTSTAAFIVDGSGNVGIGTASPSTKLDVDGDVTFASAHIAQIDGSPELLFGTTSTTHYNWRIAVQESLDTAFEIAVGEQGAGTSVASNTFTNRFLITADGKVGINGTPQHVGLDVSAGHISIDTAFSMLFDGPSGGDSISSPSANTLQFMTGGAVSMKVNNTGVAVGRDNSFTPESVLDISGSNARGQLQLRDGTSTSLYGRYYMSASFAHGLGALHIQNRAFPGSGTGDVYTHFKSSVSGGTTRMNVMVDGKLGLGSIDTIPVGESLLEVRHSGRTSTFDAADSTTWADIMVRNPQTTQNSAAGIAFQINDTYHTNASTGIAAVHQDQAYEADMAFITRGHNVVASEKMRITSGGNVGINETEPEVKLHVNDSGDTLTNNGNGDYGTGFVVARNDGLIGMTMGYQESPQTMYIQGRNFTNNGLHDILINPLGGNIGIGIGAGASPAQILHLEKDDADVAIAFTQTGQRSYHIGIDNSNSDRLTFGRSQTVGSSPIMTLDENLRVGIGTTSPGSSLDVAGEIRGGRFAFNDDTNTTIDTFAEDQIGFTLGSNQAVKWAFIAGAVTQQFMYGSSALYPSYTFNSDQDTGMFNATTNALGFSTAGSERVRIDASGRVGIGTTSPGYPLDVSGGHINLADGYRLIWGGNTNTSIMGSNGAAYLRFRTGGSERVRLTNTGLGIGTTLPSYKLDVDGDARIQHALGVGTTPNATDGRIDAANDVVAYATSDERLKENVKLIENPIDKLKQLRGVEFDWKPLTDEEKKSIHGNEGHDVGVIAQDVEKVLPEVVTERENGYKAVKYEKMVGLLIEGMKEQQKQIEELKSEIQELKDGSSK